MKRCFFRSLCILLTLVLLTSSLPAFSSAAILTEAEDNNNGETANPIGLHDTVKGSVSSAYDRDYFKFTPEQNGYITLTLNHDILMDIWAQWTVTVYRFTSSLEEIYSKELSAGEEETMPRIGVAGGADYYILVTGSDVEETEYRLTVDFTETPYWEREPNDYVTKAEPLAFGQTYGGSIRSQYDDDYFTFTPEKDGYITLTLNHDLLIGTWMYWTVSVCRFTSDLEAIYSKRLSASEEVTMPRIGVVGGADYCVLVTGNNVDDVEYRLTVDFTETPYWEHEPNDELAQAEPIAFGQTYGGSIGSQYDRDYFTFTPEKDGYITVTLDHDLLKDSSVYWEVTVYRFTSDFEEIYFKRLYATENRDLAKIGVAGGDDYYIRVSGSDVEDVEYRLTAVLTETPYWEHEKNDWQAQAEPIAFGQAYGGSIRSNDYTDNFKFTPEQNGYITLTLDHDLIKDTSMSWTVTVYRFTTSFDEIYSKAFSATENQKPAKIGVAGGCDYYIRITGEYVEDVEYCLTVELTETPYWECEKNYGFTQADTIELGQAYGGSIHPYDDQDYFKFTPEQNGYITLTLEHDLIKETSKDWEVTVYRFTTDYEEIYFKELSAAENTDMAKIGVAGGCDYYIRVSGYNVDDVEYRLTAELTETPYWECERNYDFTHADPIEFGQTYGGSIHPYDDKDYFKFTPEKSGYITVTLGHDVIREPSKYWEVTVYRFSTDYNEIYSKELSTTGNEGLPRIGVDGGANYYIRVTGYNVDDVEYHLTVSFSEDSWILGDLNRDGRITAADARLALRGAVGLEQITGDFLTIGDVNADKKITAADARKILRAAVGLETLE